MWCFKSGGRGYLFFRLDIIPGISSSLKDFQNTLRTYNIFQLWTKWSFWFFFYLYFPRHVLSKICELGLTHLFFLPILHVFASLNDVRAYKWPRGSQSDLSSKWHVRKWVYCSKKDPHLGLKSITYVFQLVFETSNPGIL